MQIEFSDAYLITFGDFAEKQFRNRVFPTNCIEGWRGMVCWIKEGYDDIESEYTNDLDRSRGGLDLFINNEVLKSFQEHKLFTEAIYKLDDEFRDLTQIHPDWLQYNKEWWHYRIPKYARMTYTEWFDTQDLKKYGVVLKVID